MSRVDCIHSCTFPDALSILFTGDTRVETNDTKPTLARRLFVNKAQ